MKIITKFLFFLALTLPIGTFANGAGSMPTNPYFTPYVEQVYGISSDNDLANFPNSFMSEGLADGYATSLLTGDIIIEPLTSTIISHSVALEITCNIKDENFPFRTDHGTEAASTATLCFTRLSGLPSLDARNDINITPVNLPVDGNVLTNDIGEALDVSGATYINGSGISTNLPLGTPTNIYDADINLAGKMTLNADGSYRFNPEEDYTGEVTISYTAKDGNGLTDSADLTVKVVPTYIPYGKNPPIAINDNLITDKNVTVTGDVLFNDTDLDGDHLTVTNINIGGTNYPVDITTGAQVTITGVGTFDINADGIFIFIPALDFTGNVPTITYTVIDGNGGDDTADLNIKVIDRIAGENSTYANDDVNSALQGDNLYGKVLENDFDPQGDNQNVTGASLHADGADYPLTFGTTVTISGVGAFTLNADGSYFFAPESTFVGTLEMAYSIEDENLPVVRPDFGEVATSSATLYLTVFARVEGICISAKVSLQGALVDLVDSGNYVSDTIMRDYIRGKGLLPFTQPYEPIYGYEGTETVTDSTVFDDKGVNSIVDWVLLELRDPTDPSIIVAKRAALLQRDGDIVTIDGVSCVRFEYYSGDYYLAIRHRNHLGVMSQNALNMTDAISYDFTLQALYDRADREEDPAFTHNGFQMLWAGDANNNGQIKYSANDDDRTPIVEFILDHPDNTFNNISFPIEEYSVFDLNMNGEVKANAIRSDLGILQQNILENSDGNTFSNTSYNLFYDNLPN